MRNLANQVWEQRHEAGTLDGERQLALVPTTHTGTLARDDLAERGQVAAQGVGVFVVHFGGVDLAEVAGAHFCELGILLVHRVVHDESKQLVRVRDEMSNETNNRLKWNVFNADFLVRHGAIDWIVHGRLRKRWTRGGTGVHRGSWS